MITNYKTLIISFFTGALLASAYFKFNPSIKTVEKVVFHETKQKMTDLNKKTIVLPDGTKITEINKHTETQTQTDFKKLTETTNRPNYRIGLIYTPQLFGQREAFTFQFQKQFIQELYLGVSVGKGTVGVSASYGF